jgi:hypothetical protein
MATVGQFPGGTRTHRTGLGLGLGRPSAHECGSRPARGEAPARRQMRVFAPIRKRLGGETDLDEAPLACCGTLMAWARFLTT